jgi:hypothetical protein
LIAVEEVTMYVDGKVSEEEESVCACVRARQAVQQREEEPQSSNSTVAMDACACVAGVCESRE